MNRSLFLLPLLVAALLLPLSAQAHKLSIFVWPEGSEIHGEVKFSGDRQAKNVPITVQNAADSTVLIETVCDEQGEFHIALPEQVLKSHPDLLFVANGGEGHRGEWLLPAKEYAEEAVSSLSTAAPSSSSGAAVDEQVLRRIVAEEVRKGLSPVRKALAESRDHEPELHDILGGIGWIVGVVGLLAWFHSRKEKIKKQSIILVPKNICEREKNGKEVDDC